MNVHGVLRSFGLALALGALFPVAAFAQQTGEEMYRELVKSSGYGHRMVYNTDREAVFDPIAGERWNGLHVDITHGKASGSGGYSGMLALFRNVSGLDYCIRSVYAFKTGQSYDRVQAPGPGNYLVPAGESHLLVVAHGLGYGEDTLTVGVAFWRPDRSRARACSDVAPAGLDAWANAFSWSNNLTFRGSRR